MTDDLRTRIAAVIDRKYNEEAIGHTYEVCLHAADAVIREVLTPEFLADLIIQTIQKAADDERIDDR